MSASRPRQQNDPHAVAPETDRPNDLTATERYWSPRVRIVASGLLILHLMAVAVPPLAFQTTGPLGLSPAVASALRLVESYSQFLYLDRGYAFFAPDPGPSHLIQVGLADGMGNRTERIYPDRREQWPRLLYHRHFMLAEYLNDIHQPPGPPEDLIKVDPRTAVAWGNARDRYERVRGSMTDHLEHAYPGKTAQIRRIEHLIPDVLEFRDEQIALTDRRLYQVLLDQPLELPAAGDLASPDGQPNSPPEPVPAPSGTQTVESSNADPSGAASTAEVHAPETDRETDRETAGETAGESADGDDEPATTASAPGSQP